eukprot:6470746-Amphidinium_carterae.1
MRDTYHCTSAPNLPRMGDAYTNIVQRSDQPLFNECSDTTEPKNDAVHACSNIVSRGCLCDTRRRWCAPCAQHWSRFA